MSMQQPLRRVSPDSKLAGFAQVVPAMFGIRFVGPAMRSKLGVPRRVKIADSSLLGLYSCRQGGCQIGDDWVPIVATSLTHPRRLQLTCADVSAQTASEHHLCVWCAHIGR